VWIRFSASAPASADSTSDCTQDFERLAESLAQSAWWRGKPSPSRSWAKRLRKGGWTTVLSGSEICEIYPRTSSLEWTGSPEDTPANPFPMLAREPESLTPDISGLSSINKSSLFDPAESSSKTSPVTSVWVSDMSSKDWISLVSLVRSACTQRRKSAHLTDGSGSSFSGWPTPVCTIRPHEGNVRMLRRAVEMGLLKEDADAMIGGDIRKPQGRLPAWPTPMARDHHDGTATANVPTNGHLGRAAPRDPTSRPGQLNPDWVEMLMGFPTGWTVCGR